LAGEKGMSPFPPLPLFLLVVKTRCCAEMKLVMKLVMGIGAERAGIAAAAELRWWR
tara:strand:+ start:437 stop:604 length:168 start_codon:yes stop_codon:yes gene_type:complete